MPSIDMVVVTGAGRGIGKAIAVELGSRGVHVFGISKTESVDATRDEIVAQGGSASSLRMDLSGDAEAIRQAVHDRVSRSGLKSVGVVLAAAVLGPTGPLSETSLEAWKECLNVNLFGNLAVAQGCMSTMLSARFGRILALAGGGSAYAYPTFPAYSASKTAMVRAVENLHEDLRNCGDFAVVCLAPGAVETRMLQQVRAAGAVVKTTVDLAEPVRFARQFLFCETCGFSGRFVHVRDDWTPYLDVPNLSPKAETWRLRRIEA
jgi:fengycin family lipopeptide synthetase B